MKTSTVAPVPARSPSPYMCPPTRREFLQRLGAFESRGKGALQPQHLFHHIAGGTGAKRAPLDGDIGAERTAIVAAARCGKTEEAVSAPGNGIPGRARQQAGVAHQPGMVVLVGEQVAHAYDAGRGQGVRRQTGQRQLWIAHCVAAVFHDKGLASLALEIG